MALSKLPSRASITVPLPSPGSVSQKYSACVSEIPLVITVCCISMDLLKIGPQLLLLSFTLIWNIWFPVLARTRLLSNISSIALSKFPSKASITVPLPSPGSVSQKYSACVSEIPLVITVCCISMDLLKIGPQLLLLSFTRILNRWLPTLGSVRLFSNISSMALSKLPSKASRTVPLPSPGSVSQKYSAWVNVWEKLKKQHKTRLVRSKLLFSIFV